MVLRSGTPRSPLAMRSAGVPMATLQVGLNKQAIAIMQNHGIPIVDMYTAITKKCGPVPQAECFDSCECLCHQCPANHGLGYSWLADSTIVPVITKLLTDDDAAKMDDNPLKACPSVHKCPHAADPRCFGRCNPRRHFPRSTWRWHLCSWDLAHKPQPQHLTEWGHH